jgi:hypothetical protein
VHETDDIAVAHERDARDAEPDELRCAARPEDDIRITLLEDSTTVATSGSVLWALSVSSRERR